MNSRLGENTEFCHKNGENVIGGRRVLALAADADFNGIPAAANTESTENTEFSMSDLNDPRVFFAAERTLLAWNRTSLAWMAFGFVIERFGLFMRLVSGKPAEPLQWGLSFWLGLAFIFIGSLIAVLSTLQYRKVLKTLKPIEIPQGYRVGVGIFGNLSVALLGIGLMVYLFFSEV